MSSTLELLSLEQGFIETLQLCVIACAFLMWGAAQKRVQPSQLFSDSLIATAKVSMLVAILLLGRETSWGSAYGLHDDSSDVLEFLGGVALIFGAVYVVQKWLREEDEKHKSFKALLQLPFVKYGVALIVFMVVSKLHDNQTLTSEHSLFIEEMSELIAYMLFFASGYSFYKTLEVQGGKEALSMHDNV